MKRSSLLQLTTNEDVGGTWEKRRNRLTFRIDGQEDRFDFFKTNVSSAIRVTTARIADG